MCPIRLTTPSKLERMPLTTTSAATNCPNVNWPIPSNQPAVAMGPLCAIFCRRRAQVLPDQNAESGLPYVHVRVQN